MRTAPHTKKPNRATVLIVVLWVCLGLVSLTLVFGHSMLMAFRGSDQNIAGYQADQAIEGAIRYAQYLLANLEEPGQLPLPENYRREKVPIGEAAFWFVGRPASTSNNRSPVYGLTDEASKLNLNTVTQPMLETLPGMTTELAASIIDWRDEDDEITEGGAETETYQLRKPSTVCKNARFETVEELALVNGATWEILFGEDLNRNGVLDPNENDGSATPPNDNADGRLDPGLIELFTVYSKESNSREDGSAKLNVNQPSEDLTSFLQETLGEETANQVISRTSGAQYQSLMQYFIRSQLSPDQCDLIASDLTTTNEEQEGLINVNTASEYVLACIPGIDEQTAAQIVSTRERQNTPHKSVQWIVDIIGEENAIQAGPFITAQSWQITADVAAVGRYGRGYRREQAVLDATQTPAAILYRRRLGGLGWALGTQTLQDLDRDFSQR
jgi:DNA uptake protein ComE-like DNA-binding protein